MYNEVTVFMENKPGKLSKVAEILAAANIDILAVDVNDEGQFGVLKILTMCPEEAKKALENAGQTVALNQVVCIEIDDKPGGLLKLAKALEGTGINITNSYGCVLERGKRAVFVVKGDNLEAIENAAKAAGLVTLDKL